MNILHALVQREMRNYSMVLIHLYTLLLSHIGCILGFNSLPTNLSYLNWQFFSANPTALRPFRCDCHRRRWRRRRRRRRRRWWGPDHRSKASCGNRSAAQDSRACRSHTWSWIQPASSFGDVGFTERRSLWTREKVRQAGLLGDLAHSLSQGLV